jgi:DnaJ-class molecular chaperone
MSVFCPDCNGEGYLEDWDGSHKNCAMCNGLGRVLSNPTKPVSSPKQMEETVEVTVGKEWRSSNLFSVNLLTKKYLTPEYSKIPKDTLAEYDAQTLDNLILTSLKTEPHKRYRIKVTAELITETQKTPNFF